MNINLSEGVCFYGDLLIEVDIFKPSSGQGVVDIHLEWDSLHSAY